MIKWGWGEASSCTHLLDVEHVNSGQRFFECRRFEKYGCCTETEEDDRDGCPFLWQQYLFWLQDNDDYEEPISH